jgi:hypothetical protein
VSGRQESRSHQIKVKVCQVSSDLNSFAKPDEIEPNFNQKASLQEAHFQESTNPPHQALQFAELQDFKCDEFVTFRLRKSGKAKR